MYHKQYVELRLSYCSTTAVDLRSTALVHSTAQYAPVFAHGLYSLSEYPRRPILRTFPTLLNFLFQLFQCLNHDILGVLSISYPLSVQGCLRSEEKRGYIYSLIDQIE